MRKGLVRLAELIRKDGAPYLVTPLMIKVWINVFRDVHPLQAEAAFASAERELKFWPSPAEVLGFISTAEEKASQEQAEQKWQQVLHYIRVYYSPDIPCRDHDYPDGRKQNAPRILERTQRAINAAGGLAYLADCDPESLQWAKKKFIEQYVRYGELKKDEHLLPDGRVRDLLADVAGTKHVDRLLVVPPPVEPAIDPAPVLKAVKTVVSKAVSATRVVDIVGRKTELARQAELVREKYPTPGNMSGIPETFQRKCGDKPCE